MSADLEMLREIFKDNRVHLTCAIVQKVEVLLDRSKCKVQALTLPDEVEIIAEVGFASIGPNAGDVQIPVPEDLVLVAYTDVGAAYVISRLSSKTDKIPLQAIDGDRSVQALAGKQLYLGSDTKVLIGAGGLVDPEEPLVLGTVLKSMLTDLIAKVDAILTKLIAGPLVVCAAPGAAGPTFPQLITDLTAIQVQVATIKTTYIDTPASDILSTLAFTER